MDINEEYLKILNEEIPSDFIQSTLDKISKNPGIFGGKLSANSFDLDMIASYAQSRNIKYGNAVEKVFSKILKENGWTVEKTKYNLEEEKVTIADIGASSDKKSIDVDQVISYKNKLVFIEQKIRDNHDTSKWEGQLDNYIVKFRALERIYSDKNVYGIMWMIDPGYGRNKDNYKNGMEKSDYLSNDRNFVLVEKDIDVVLNQLKGDKKEYYDKLYSVLSVYHESTAHIPNINLEEEKVEHPDNKESICRITKYFMDASVNEMNNLFKCFGDENCPLEIIMPTGIAFTEYLYNIKSKKKSKRRKFEKAQLDENGELKSDSPLAKILARYSSESKNE